jgi:Ca2+/Na+ antiporter
MASVAQNRSTLALGNVLGSSITNIFGAFSLGLLFHPGHMEFDSAAQIYTSILFAPATVFTALALFRILDRAIGGSLITLFVVYLLSIGYAIYRGVHDAPDHPDDDCDEDTINNAIHDEEQAVPEYGDISFSSVATA